MAVGIGAYINQLQSETSFYLFVDPNCVWENFSPLVGIEVLLEPEANTLSCAK